MPYLNTKNISNIKMCIPVNVDLTNKLLQVYDSTTNYCSFNIETIIGCSVLITKTENPNLTVNLSYFNRNTKLSFLKMHFLYSELNKNEGNSIILTDWIKECLKRNKSDSEFMIIDTNQHKKYQIEILRNMFKFNKIVYTNIHCLKDMVISKSIKLKELPKNVIIIGESKDYNKVVNLLSIKNKYYGFTDNYNFDKTFYSMFFNKPSEMSYIKIHNEEKNFIALNSVNYGIFANNSKLNSIIEDIFEPKKLSYYVSGMYNEKPITEHLIDSKGFKIYIKNNDLIISIPKLNSNRFGLMFPSFNDNNSFNNIKLSSVSIICENNGCFTVDGRYNISNVTRFKLAEDKLQIF